MRKRKPRFNLFLIVNIICCILIDSENSISEELIFSQKQPVIGGVAAVDTPGYLFWKYFETNVAEKSNNRIIVKLFLNGEMGPEETMFRRLRRNKVQLAGISTASLSLAVPELSILRLPFLFESDAEIDFILESKLKNVVSDLLLEKDILMLDWQSAGWMNFYGTFPIRIPSDFLNKRMRVSIEDVSIRYMQAIGADFTQIPFTDVIPALQTGLIDGGEQSTQLFITGGLYSEATYYTLSRHAYVMAIIVANNQWFQKLSNVEKNIYRESVMKDKTYRTLFLKKNTEQLGDLEKKGLNIISLKDEEEFLWKEPVDKMTKKILLESSDKAKNLYNLITRLKNEYKNINNDRK